MIWFPEDAKKPHILLFQFTSWCRGPEISHTEFVSTQEALEDFRSSHPDAIETEIVVLAKKGNSKNAISHKLTYLEKEHPNTWFFAVLDAHTVKKMHEEADLNWQKEKAILHTKIRDTAYKTQDACLDDLPTKLRARIKVNDNGCWLWFSPRRRNVRGNLRKTTRIPSDRYGRVRFEGKSWATHRLIYTLLIGEIPMGALLRHVCDTPACVNPLHLELGIVEDNVRDMIERKRAAWQRPDR